MSALVAADRSGGVTRHELAERTGLSRSAVASLVRGLLAEGIVAVEENSVMTDAAHSQRGRPPDRITLVRPAGVVVGVDLGNSHVRVAVEARDHTPLIELNREIEVGADPFGALDVAATTVRAALEGTGSTPTAVQALVFGVPAPVRPAERSVGSNNILPSWEGVDPGAELGARLQMPVSVWNDANLGVVGEQRYGAGRGHQSLIYVKVATGIGAGLMLDGRVLEGVSGTAGEIGHVRIDPHGVVCRCGARGCLETVVSLPHVLRALAMVTSDDLGIAGLRKLISQGHDGARRVVADVAVTLGRVLADVCTVLNPGCIVVGGPLEEANAFLAYHLEGMLRASTPPPQASAVTVVASEFGDRVSLIGALAVAHDQADAAVHGRHQAP